MGNKRRRQPLGADLLRWLSPSNGAAYPQSSADLPALLLMAAVTQRGAAERCA
jgi:hypothetical protein